MKVLKITKKMLAGSKKRKPPKKIKVLAIDFDGTIHDVKHPIEGRRMGGPISGAKEALEYLKIREYKIVIFCYWAKDTNSIQIIADWMNYWGCKFDEITNIKPMAEAYIDDKGIRFTNWTEVLEKTKNLW
jgi:hypothetical protein